MEQEILSDLLLRDGMAGKETLLKSLIADGAQELRDLTNYSEDDPLPSGCKPIIKEIVLIRYNLDGVGGIQSESQSGGGSTTYLEDLPTALKKRIRKYRKLPGVV